jgi:NAD(P)-dependent dehydrogenase (short-subunit alcohol dehydrogenase family)
MDLNLGGKRVLVTGGSKGLGLAIARRFASEGCDIYLASRTKAVLEGAADTIRRQYPVKVNAIAIDLAQPGFAERVAEACGDVDILVNNAGIFEIRDAFDIPDEDWQRLFATNVLSGVRLTRHYGSRMRDKKFGRVVFISSESGVQIPTEMIHYGFTKAADLALMRGFAQALAASGVTVNAVLPGPTLTEGVAAMFKSMGQSAEDPKVQRDFIDSARPSSIIKRLALPQEVAEAVTFLCSREASAITGSPVRADGGVVMSIT